MAKAVVIPKAWVTRLGKGNHTNGAALLDGFTGYNGQPIDWHEPHEEGDYVLWGKATTSGDFASSVDSSEITARVCTHKFSQRPHKSKL